MDIQIQDQHPLHAPLLQEDPRGNGQVIDDAEAGARIREGVVRASCCVAGQPVLQGQPRRQQRPCGALRDVCVQKCTSTSMRAGALCAHSIRGEDSFFCAQPRWC